MAYFRYECFGSLTYDTELSYEEVLAREEALQEQMQAVLEDGGAKHIDFVPINDSLQIQCAFADMAVDDFRLLCADVAPLTINGIRGRLTLVDRDLDTVHLAVLANGRAFAGRLTLPPPEKAHKGLKSKVEALSPLSPEEAEHLHAERAETMEEKHENEVRQPATTPGYVPGGWLQSWVEQNGGPVDERNSTASLLADWSGLTRQKK